jgi:branched-chain amino acid transport system substrate-binding protein
MTRNRLAWKALAVASAAALVLAACGGDDDDAESEPTEEESAPAVAQGDGTLKLGSILPQTGSLAFLGPPEFAGVDLAVQEINEAGGVLGQDVAVSHGDSGDTTTNTASVTVDRLLSEDVDAIIGAASSAVTLTVIDKITGAGVVQFSPANTSTTLSTYADNGLYFRTAPPDQFQGAVLADQVASDGAATAGVLALQDSYGDSLKSVFIDSFSEAGGEVVAELTYDPNAADFSADVGQIAAANPDAVVLIGFEESGKVVEAMFAAGIGPDSKPLYLVDGNLSNTLFATAPPGSLEGTKGTLPGAEAPTEFRDRLLTVDPSLSDFSYAAESYDAAILIALAAVAAENDSGEAIASELQNVSREGEKCTSFAECSELLAAGEDIDYDGVSGPIEFDDNGDPGEASIGVYEYGPDNKYSSTAIRYVTGEVPPLPE